MKDKNYEAVLKEVCDLGTHITVFIADLGLLPEKPEEFFKEIVADKELKEDSEAYTLFFECAFRKKIVEHAQEKFLLNKAEKAMKRTGVLDTKKTLSTDHLCHITREVIQYADLLKVFTNVYVRSANRVEIWGELECFSDDVDGWVETVSHDKRYYDKRIKHDGVDVLISLYESLPQRKEYEEHE